MIETEFRILDILSREIGHAISINKTAEKIRALYGSGDYKNINIAMNNLEKKNIIVLEQSGKSSIASLNFENYLITDLLAEMEIKKKMNFLEGRKEFQMLALSLDMWMKDYYFIKSISLIKPERNARLNKAELLILLKHSKNGKALETEIDLIRATLQLLQQIHNIKIDYFLLDGNKFFDLLKSEEANTSKEILSHKIVIFNSQNFWTEIKEAIQNGIRIKMEEQETNPAKISEEDLVFNLARFGYTEFGPKIKQGRLICIEYIIIAIMFQNDARRIDAIPVILAKNSDKTNYDLLLFLARKYGFGGRILGILKALRNLVAHGMKVIDEPIRLLEAMKIEEVKANQKSIKEKLRLYNVTR